MFDPVLTAFELPNGKNQPFIHIMFDEDTIVNTGNADNSALVDVLRDLLEELRNSSK